MLEITPYSNVGPFLFGQTREAAEQLFGVPSARRQFRDASTVTYRNKGVRLHFDPENKLREVEAIEQQVFSINGQSLWGPEFLALADLDDQAAVYGSVLILPKLGIASSGFHEYPESGQSITAFRRGLWDPQLSSARPWAHVRK